MVTPLPDIEDDYNLDPELPELLFIGRSSFDRPAQDEVVVDAPLFVVGGKARSPGWGPLQRKFIKANPTCSCCSRKAQVVHHKDPYHLFPEKELDPANLMSACNVCHLCVLHAGDFRLWVVSPDVVALGHYNVVVAAQERSKRSVT